MDSGHYAGAAAELVNADLTTTESLAAYLADREWLSSRVTPADIRALRKTQEELRAVIDDSAQGNEAAVVATLNELLERHPVRPRISGHDASTWHLHINDSGDSVAAILTGEALYGMTLTVTEIGADRFGWCADTGCSAAYFDATANHSKRFCSQRCATRTNVAAYRRRHATSPES
ncbi:MAG TPA: CGNR zinc finger domain-containing protein [Mycobacteriales bacterium]|jgi:predicted RNA-binding Zn ribbon-like protein|nr:CGNR zinc finger domain-containing protein [Mycobacteriales bacterium]